VNPVDGALRKAILAAASNDQLERFAGRYGLQLGASRFVAGRTLDECVAVLRCLNDKGFKANTTLLGESVHDEREAERVVADYEGILARLDVERLRANVALKLTHLGLEIDEELAYANVERLVRSAAELGSFIRIDMEYSGVVDATLRTYRRLRETGHTEVGTVLQSYLYRSDQDLRDLVPLHPNLRIVKGAYLEPASVAYPRKQDVDYAYARLVEVSLRDGGYTAIATHDERLIEHAIAFAERESIPRERFEFQMLYGVRQGLQQSLLERGYEVLVATPFGPEWFPFFMRRLAERPANLGFVAKNLVRR
jgi:proline dehydrogenase